MKQVSSPTIECKKVNNLSQTQHLTKYEGLKGKRIKQFKVFSSVLANFGANLYFGMRNHKSVSVVIPPGTVVYVCVQRTASTDSDSPPSLAQLCLECTVIRADTQSVVKQS